MTGDEIARRALEYRNCVYWYGAKGQPCTVNLLSQLSCMYPGMYTLTYKRKCLEDIEKHKTAIDCSGLVCKAYGIDQISTYKMPEVFTQFNGVPANGMVVWNKSHVGIYFNGRIIEARGIDYDVTTNRKYRAKDWARIYIMRGVDYGGSVERSALEYLQAAIDTIAGKYGNGSRRKEIVVSFGYNYDKLQNIINAAYAKENKV